MSGTLCPRVVATSQLPCWKPLLADNLSVKKHIYIYSPSGAVRDKAAFKRGIKRLITLGHEVEVDPDALCSDQRFAGDDATRLWDAIEIVATTSGMAELKRSLRAAPQFD